MSDESLYRKTELDEGEDTPASLSPYLHDTRPSSRVPNLGHALLFLSFAGLLLLFTQLIAISLAHTAHDAHASAEALLQPKRQLATMAITYLVTLAS